MLLRGSSLVGYANYPDNLVRAFIKEAARTGIDVFRVFDSLNWLPGMEVAMDEVLNQASCAKPRSATRATSSTPSGTNIRFPIMSTSPRRSKNAARTSCASRICRPAQALCGQKLVTALKNEVGLPIHLHTHDTSQSGGGAAARGRGGRGHRGHGDRLALVHDQPAVHERGCRRAARAGARHRARPGSAPVPEQLLGGCAPALCLV